MYWLQEEVGRWRLWLSARQNWLHVEPPLFTAISRERKAKKSDSERDVEQDVE